MIIREKLQSLAGVNSLREPPPTPQGAACHLITDTVKMEGQGANWACQPHPGVEQTPHTVSGVQTEQPPTLQPPQCCSENEGRAPTMGCHPTPGAQLSKSIAAPIGSPAPPQVLLHGAQTAQLFLGSQEPGRPSTLHSQLGLKKKGHRALCVQFFPQIFQSDQSLP